MEFIMLQGSGTDENPRLSIQITFCPGGAIRSMHILWDPWDLEAGFLVSSFMRPYSSDGRIQRKSHKENFVEVADPCMESLCTAVIWPTPYLKALMILFTDGSHKM